MKLKIVILANFLTASATLHAALGGRVEELPAEMKISGKAIMSTPHFTAHEFAQGKLVVKQFADDEGQIFAVTWSGKGLPDLRALMGAKFPLFEEALANAKKSIHGHSPFQIDWKGMHLEMGGRALSHSGRAWLIENVPASMDTHDLH